MANDQTQADQTRIQRVIENYITAMRGSQPDVLASLFTDDGILMAADAPTIIGAENIKAFFAQGLEAVSIAAELDFDETTVTADHAFVLTHSKVTLTMKPSNAVLTENNRELFVLRNAAGEWKIARYMFNKAPA